jgi:hypothetical protein
MQAEVNLHASHKQGQRHHVTSAPNALRASSGTKDRDDPAAIDGGHLIERMRGMATSGLSTDEIMASTRGEDD